MTETKYGKYIITEPKPFPPEVQARHAARRSASRSTLESIHLLSVDGDIVEGMFYADCAWLWKGSSDEQLEEAHTHEFPEIIAFIGSNRDAPQSLGGEITIWLDGEKHVLNKTCLIFVPPGARHCPIVFNRIDHPVLFGSIAPSTKYTHELVSNVAAPGSGPKCRIITEVAEFDGGATGSRPAPPPGSTVKGARVMHLEENVAKGGFYADFVWIYEGTGAAPAPEHSHEWPEVIAMVGVDPEHPRDLGGTMSIVLGGETHYITKSSMVCIPPGLRHCPWKFLDIKKPTLVFTTGPSAMYTGTHRDSPPKPDTAR